MRHVASMSNVFLCFLKKSLCDVVCVTMSTYLNLRIASAVGDRLKPHAAALNWSPNAFAEQCVVAVLDMIEDESLRTVPDMVVMLDAKRNRSRPALGGAVKCPAADEESATERLSVLRVAEEARASEQAAKKPLKKRC
jgi:hypothetical protein